jgi:hypothetical protein
MSDALPVTEAFTESALVAVSTCEELLEIDEERIGKLNLVVVYIRNEGLTTPWVQRALELLRVRLPDASTVVLADRNDGARRGSSPKNLGQRPSRFAQDSSLEGARFELSVPVREGQCSSRLARYGSNPFQT